MSKWLEDYIRMMESTKVPEGLAERVLEKAFGCEQLEPGKRYPEPDNIYNLHLVDRT
ncbi:hypothetical protein [Adlercreutzia sp. ZJ242]|uniref:hypothetical protein n=1 Tax=Adlercreutzia sp. ZJ242 TaxID=2709409 RepID=UPI0013EA56B4|nr:hypothetical protein [Adlercreutzia sp. ZJ242]